MTVKSQEAPLWMMPMHCGCYDVDMVCPLTVHVLEGWSPLQYYQEVKEPLKVKMEGD